MSASRFLPSVDEVRKRREDTGVGLVDCKRELTKRNVTGALEGMIGARMTENERTLRDALLCILQLIR